MTEAGTATEHTYVVLDWRVKQSIEKLLSRNTHPFFIAYLWLRRRGMMLGDMTEITPDWGSLEPYLRVPGGPAGKPHLRPFWKGARNSRQEWLNENLAGSFAPSSFRSEYVTPVVTTNAAGRYVLRGDHWKQALDHFLYGERLPAVAVAAFLLRDFGLIASSPPQPIDLVNAFREEFRFPAASEEKFDTLFDIAWGTTTGPAGTADTGWPAVDEPWFEELRPDVEVEADRDAEPEPSLDLEQTNE